MARWLPSVASVRAGMARPRPVRRDQVVLAAKTAIAAGVAWLAALAANPHSRPYFAPLAVLLVVQPTVYDSLSRAVQRVAGVLVGVTASLAVSHVLAPSAWSIAIIIFAGLLVGWTARLGPQGVVQVPVSALLVFLVGQTTPGYGGERIADTLIGAGVAVIAVLLTPLHRCAEIVRAISAGIETTWNAGQASSWRLDAIGLIDSCETARRKHEGFALSTRWNARARRPRAALGQAEESLRAGERIAIYIRSMARALVDGSGDARPMPAISEMLASTASAAGAYAAWLASGGTPEDLGRLAEAVRGADDALTRVLARVQERWGSDPGRWLTVGVTLAMSQRILAEVSRPVGPG